MNGTLIMQATSVFDPADKPLPKSIAYLNTFVNHLFMSYREASP